MAAPPISIPYPLFTIRIGEGFPAYSLDAARPRGTGRGLLFFTTREKAAGFLSRVESSPDAAPEIIEIDRQPTLGLVLRGFRNRDQLFVIFDPDLDRRAVFRGGRREPVQLILQQFFENAEWMWQFPLHCIRIPGRGVACRTLRREGKPVNSLAVYTDWELADRALLVIPFRAMAHRIQNAAAFVRLLRAMPNIEFVTFDPPLMSDGTRHKLLTIPRDDLLEDLGFMISPGSGPRPGA